MIFNRFPVLFGLISMLALVTACTNQAPATRAEEVQPFSHRFQLEIEDVTAKVQVAISPREMARGLMERGTLKENEGMLFAYRQPKQASFWMRNTPLPLDIGFFNSDGILMEVYPLFPYDETSVKSRSTRVLFALEMNQGWFSQNKLRPGAAVDLETLRAALEGRGSDPAEFGL